MSGSKLGGMTEPVLCLKDLVVRYPGAPSPTLDGLELELHPAGA